MVISYLKTYIRKESSYVEYQNYIFISYYNYLVGVAVTDNNLNCMINYIILKISIL